jgi:deoxyxylulose-5-phosphate synthase
LLEQLKPYDKIADDVARLLPTTPCRVLFLEEEIRTGGMGMNLSAALATYDVMQNKTVFIKALDDHFAIQTKNEPIWHSFGLDCDAIVCDILR